MSQEEVILKGTPVAHGVAIGKPFFFSFVEDTIPKFSVHPSQIETEITRYNSALSRSRDEIVHLRSQLEHAKNFEGAAIIEAQLQIMQDPSFTTDIEKEIRNTRKNAEASLHTVINRYEKKFKTIPNPFFRERFKDILDINRRIMSHLRSSVRISLAQLPPNSIIFSRELSATDTAEAHMACAAFVTKIGGTTSHAAIVAKARGTPFVSNIPFEKLKSHKHSIVIVDGRTGEIIFSPKPKTLAKYQRLRNKLQTHLDNLGDTNVLKVETYDGHTIRLSANIEMSSELEMLHRHGGHGVGLFRSEYICLSKKAFPTEEEQFQIYKDLVEKMEGLPIVIRTFDVGGDKGMPSQQKIEENNPSLGCRAIRFLLKEKSIFKTQLRAILRTSCYGEVSIMFPMVSSLSELIEAKQIMSETRKELETEGAILGKVRIGCMIEVPSAALIADFLAKECDFLSIGTNDLVQYALAVDRANHEISTLYTPLHPSVIRMIRLIVQEANFRGIPVTLCGEMASDPRFTALLLGLGVHELSVATRYIPVVKNTIRNTSIVMAMQFAEKVLTLSTSNEIQDLLAEEYRKNNPEDCFYNI